MVAADPPADGPKAPGSSAMDTMYAPGHAYETAGHEPTTVEVAGIVSLALLQQLAFVIIFTEVGYGDEMFRAVSPFIVLAYTIGWCGVAVLVLLYLLDARHWSEGCAPLKYALGAVGVLAILVGLVLAQGAYPTLPLAVYMFIVPCAYYALRRGVFADVALHRFLFVSAVPLTVGGLCMAVGWVLWVVITGYTWDGETQDVYYERVNCDPDDDACLPGALLYFAPLGAGLVNATFGLACFALAARTGPNATSKMGKSRATLHVLARVFAACLVLIASGLYLQAAVHGSNPYLAYSVLFFSLAGLIVLSVVAANVVGFEELRRRFVDSPLVKSVSGSLASGDVVKAIMIFGGWCPLAIFFTLSVVKQRVRVLVWLKRGQDVFEDKSLPLVVRRADWFTTAGQALWDTMSKWEWTSVLTKTIWVGIVFFVLAVTSAILPVFVAWLRVALIASGVELWVIVLVVALAGLILFMIPPVPGAGIYYMSPVILTQVMDFYAAIGVACALSFFLKLFALVIQQKIIGEQLGHFVAVRSIARVNSVHTRAIREVLSQPGWTRGKVAILVGGPDWPTSVLTGILRLNVFSMMLGTTPIIVIIIAFVVNGAYLTTREQDPLSREVYNVSLAVAIVVGLAAQLLALHYIVDMVEKKRADLEAEPNDPEVEAKDRELAERNRAFREATKWTGNAEGLKPTPMWMKGNILAAVTLQLGTCYVIGLNQPLVFEDFTYADTIDDRLGGDWTNIVKFEGRFLLLAWLISVAGLMLFRTWSRRRLAAYYRTTAPAADMQAGAVTTTTGPSGSGANADSRTV